MGLIAWTRSRVCNWSPESGLGSPESVLGIHSLDLGVQTSEFQSGAWTWRLENFQILEPGVLDMESGVRTWFLESGLPDLVSGIRTWFLESGLGSVESGPKSL